MYVFVYIEIYECIVMLLEYQTYLLVCFVWNYVQMYGISSCW